MKLIILLASVLFSAQTFACSCDYDYYDRHDDKVKRMAKLVDVDFKTIQLTDSQIRTTAMATIDPANYGQCGCTSFVKITWQIAYSKADKACSATAVYSVWNDKMKVKEIDCK